MLKIRNRFDLYEYCNEKGTPLSGFNEPVKIELEKGDRSLSGLFADCNSFNQDIIIPSGVTNISAILKNCYSFNSKIIFEDGDNNVIYNAANAFKNCLSLEHIDLNLPYLKESMVEDMFLNCSSLKTCKLKLRFNPLTNLGGIFYNCYNLEELIINDDNKGISYPNPREDHLFKLDKKTKNIFNKFNKWNFLHLKLCSANEYIHRAVSSIIPPTQLAKSKTYVYTDDGTKYLLNFNQNNLYILPIVIINESTKERLYPSPGSDIFGKVNVMMLTTNDEIGKTHKVKFLYTDTLLDHKIVHEINELIVNKPFELKICRRIGYKDDPTYLTSTFVNVYVDNDTYTTIKANCEILKNL